MKWQSGPHESDERLNAEKALIEAALANTGPGPRHNLLKCQLRQIETALEIAVSKSTTERPQKSPGSASMKDMVTSPEKLGADAAEAALIQEDHRLLPFNPYGRVVQA